MGITLKSFDELKKEFNDTVTAYCISENKDEKQQKQSIGIPVRELPNKERAQQIALLQSVFAQLEQDKMTNNPTSIDIIYGAMITITEIIYRASSGLSDGGQLYTGLIDVMGLTYNETKKEQPKFSNEFKLKALKAFNNFVLNAYPARNIYAVVNNAHKFSDVPAKKLDKLLKDSFKLEKTTSHTIIKALAKSVASVVPESKTEVAVATDAKALPEYTISEAQKTPPTITMPKFSELAPLSEELSKLKTQELGIHHRSLISQLDAPRAQQLAFLVELEKNLQQLQSINEREKVVILHGAMFIVHAQIAKEYKKSSTISTSPIPNSNLHTHLSDILNPALTPNNYIERFVAATCNYLHFMCTETVPNSDKRVMKTEHIFTKIKDFDLSLFLLTANDIIYDCRTVADKTIENQSSYSQSFSTLFSTALTATKKSVVAEGQDEEEDDDTSSNNNNNNSNP